MKVHLITSVIFVLSIVCIGYILTSPNIIGGILVAGIFFLIIFGLFKLYKSIHRSVKNIWG
jgi:hypothetical protein